MRPRIPSAAHANSTRAACLLFALSVMVSTPVNAGFIMRVTDGTSTVDVQDQGTNDTSPLEGIIGWGGEDVGGIDLQGLAGLSKPAEGSNSSPELVLTLAQATTTSGGGVSILLTDTGFSATLPTAELTVNGGTGGPVNFRSWGDPSDAEFGMGFDTGSLLDVTGDFRDSQQTSVGNSVGSLTLQWDLALASAAQSTGGVASIMLVPEPASAGLAGLALLGCAMAGRHRGQTMRDTSRNRSATL